MNNPNPWENQLRKWAPRRPSDRLRARLFAPANSLAGPPPAPGPASWLVPACLCGLLLLAMPGLNGRHLTLLPPSGTNALLAAAIANSLPGSNRLAGLSLEEILQPGADG